MLGSRLRPLSAVEKQRLAGTQLASFLATFRVGLPSSLKLSLNWFFFCLSVLRQDHTVYLGWP